MASSKPPKRTTSGEISAVKEPALKEFLEKLEEEEKEASSRPPPLDPEAREALERLAIEDAERRRREIEAAERETTKQLPTDEEKSPDTEPERPEEP